MFWLIISPVVFSHETELVNLLTVCCFKVVFTLLTSYNNICNILSQAEMIFSRVVEFVVCREEEQHSCLVNENYYSHPGTPCIHRQRKEKHNLELWILKKIFTSYLSFRSLIFWHRRRCTAEEYKRRLEKSRLQIYERKEKRTETAPRCPSGSSASPSSATSTVPTWSANSAMTIFAFPSHPGTPPSAPSTPSSWRLLWSRAVEEHSWFYH